MTQTPDDLGLGEKQTQPGFVVGLDGGGSKTLAVLADLHGVEVGRGTAGASNYQTVGADVAWSAITAAIHAAYTSAGIPFSTARGLCLGLAGVGRPEDRLWVEDKVRTAHLAEHWLIANDGQLLLKAGTPQGWGVGVISGTGSIAFGRTPDGREGRAGGWGYILGDEGSGYAIGRSALQAVMQAADGRQNPTSLTARILEQWQLQQAVDLVGKVYRSGVGRVEIAALAELVLEEAAAGDQAALVIEEQAAVGLAAQAAAVARLLDFDGDVPCAVGGGVLAHSPRLVSRMVQQALREEVTLSPVECVFSPVVGAVRLALDLVE